MTRPSKDPLVGLSQSNPLHMKPVQGLVGTYDFQCPWQVSTEVLVSKTIKMN